ncbi:MAG: TIGR00269 family protein [Nanoarchaeota archaeon]|nr:TIGR00269 family protein [Nanoarchaeota archaeon]MBU4300616.1 TIGR00269 family protein [Nanoarchaeota archaeon]MBU4452169.1 TIGR00269 family protein [Nanoarchaeota archaeon]MCG2724209.1 TIGR00269 family protein [archaeon]
MHCSYCSKPAVIYRRYEGRALCRRHFIHSFERIVKRTIRENRLIDKKKHIAVGLSGGKDSCALLYILHSITKDRPNIKLSAILINEGIKGYRTEKHAKAICKKFKVPLHIAYFKKEWGKTLDELMKREKKNNASDNLKACTYCGTMRRFLINKTAREIGADTVAIGHNLDDEAQAIMANYIRGDLLRGVRLGANAFSIQDSRFIPRIKPLREVLEKEVAVYAILKGFNADFGECPYAEQSFRWDVRNILNNLETKYPGTKYSVLRTFDRIKPALEATTKTTAGIGTCKICGEPASNDVCKVCELIARA